MVAPTKVKRRFIAASGQSNGQGNGSTNQLFNSDSECECSITYSLSLHPAS